MSDPDIVGEIYEPDIHDGAILKVQHNGATARVLVKTYDDQLYAFQFDLVQSVKSLEPEGMMLYSLIEMGRRCHSDDSSLPIGPKTRVCWKWWRSKSEWMRFQTKQHSDFQSRA